MVNKMTNPTYNRARSSIIKNVLILSNVHNIFNPRDTEVVICVMLIILKRADGINQHLNIRCYTRPSSDIPVKQYSTLNRN